MRRPSHSTQRSALITRLDEVHRIAVVRPGQLGDVLLAVPGLRALRKRLPQAEIVLVAQEWAIDLPRRLPYIDRVLILEQALDPLHDPAAATEQLAASDDAKKGNEERSPFDLVLQLQGDEPLGASVALGLGGRVTAGYCRDKKMGARFDILLEMDEKEHEVLRVLRLLRSLGIEPDGEHLSFPLIAEDRAELETVPGLKTLLGQTPLVVLHPGARAPARRWPAGSFAALAGFLHARHEATLLVVGGPGEETISQDVVANSGVPIANLTGPLSLGGLAALLSGADLFIGNDSGPAQLAAAVASRSLRIFGPANPHRWAPLDHENHRTIHNKVECSPCGYWECPIDHRCLKSISVHRVLEEAEALLSTSR